MARNIVPEKKEAQAPAKQEAQKEVQILTEYQVVMTRLDLILNNQGAIWAKLEEIADKLTDKK